MLFEEMYRARVQEAEALERTSEQRRQWGHGRLA